MPVLKFFTKEELNFFKFASIVYDEIPNMLRQTFETMWNKRIATLPGHQVWDDSPAVRNLLLTREGGTTAIPTNKSFEEWDCTALFKATIYSKTFGVTTTTTTKTLWEQYLKGKKPSTFHSSVISPTANQDESLTLAIDQLRLLRNTLCHKSNPSLSKIDFDRYVQLAKDAFTATGVSTDRIDDIGNLREEHFPTEKVIELNERIKADMQGLLVQGLSEQQKNNKLFQERVLGTLHSMQRSGKAIKVLIGTVLLVILLVFVVGVTLFQPTKIYQSSPSTLARRINTSNPIFIGRRWLFKQLEDFFEKNDRLNGALLVGDPGSGKTAIMKQLVNSPINSSRFIHQNIIAYHFCQFDEESTRDGGEFVKSLVEQLSLNVSGFKASIQNQKIQRKLRECKDYPIQCAKMAVLEPLHKLTEYIPPGTKKFILIDALDECREKRESHKSVIIDIFHDQKIGLPSWVKLLVSSRNITTITGKMSEIEVGTIALRPRSKYNLDDIRSFAQEIISRHDFRKTNGESIKEKLNESIESILNKTDGNFLFINTLLDDWATNPDKIDLTSIPSDMKHVYALSFRNRFEKEELNRIAKVFAVLLASIRPLTLKRLYEILTLKDPECEWDEVVNKLYPYLRLDNEIVRIYHQSFAEWLTIRHNEPIDGFSIKKSRGHQYIADYLFDHYNEPENELTVKGLYELSMHVLNGGMLQTHVRKLKGLNCEVTDQLNESILHYLARNGESTDVLELFIAQFKSVDIPNKYNWTPAYYATKEGNYLNLKLLIEKGADVNYASQYSYGICILNMLSHHFYLTDFGFLIFTAVQAGYTEIVELLIKHNAHLDIEHVCGYKPLHVAVGQGHLKIVELLINKTDRTSSDLFALFRATVLNHSDVLNFLLGSGIRDKCIPCKRNYKDISTKNFTIHRFLEENCGSVLNIAVSRNNLNIVKMLLSYGNDTLECKSYVGLTPLMRAVEMNNIKMVTLLLDAGADIEAQCETKSFDIESFDTKNFDPRSVGTDRFDLLIYIWIIFKSGYSCSCTNKAIHISAIQGTPEITTELIKRNANPFSKDCAGVSAIDFVAAYHQYRNTSILNENSSMLYNKTIIRYLAVCGFVKTLKTLSRNKSSDVFTAIHEDGMTLLHLATLCLTNLFHPVCAMINCTAFQRSHHYVERIKLLIKVSPQSINKKDKHGRTALHYAALVRSPDVVKYLIQKGSDWKIKDENGDTALKFMLKRPLDYINLGPCSTVFFSLLNSSEMTISIETHANCLIKLETLTTNCEAGKPSTIVQYITSHNLPLSWYTLLKIDADINCLFRRYSNFEIYGRMSNPIATISELLKVLKFDVKVNCEVPYMYSNLHIIEYHSLYPVEKNYISSLQRLVDTHPMGSRILDESYSMEGLLPFHWAVLGGAIDAVDWFMKLGVDIWKKTRSGWTAFDLSFVIYLPRILDRLLNNITSNPEYKVPSGFDFWCNTTNAPYSLLHLAAINGLSRLSYIRNNTFIPISHLPFTSCNNTHGINILYLTKLRYDVEWTTEWKDLGFPSNTTLSKYPEREAEYHLIYNNFFLMPNVNLNFEVNVPELFRCPGINDLLPHRHVIERQVERCSIRCSRSAISAIHVGRSFLSTSYTEFPRDVHDLVLQMAELRYRCVQKSYKVPSRLWRQVSKAYTCSHKWYCLEIMLWLQTFFTSKPTGGKVGKFVAERMGWHNTSHNGDVLYRWPFSFLLKKALKMDKDYEYLKALGVRFRL